MNRNRIRRRSSIGIMLVALCTIAITGAIEARASDQDGVAGYSMRLKFKNFSAEDGDGSNGVTGEVALKTSPPTSYARLSTPNRVDRSLPIWRVYTQWLAFWIWK